MLNQQHFVDQVLSIGNLFFERMNNSKLKEDIKSGENSLVCFLYGFKSEIGFFYFPDSEISGTFDGQLTFIYLKIQH